MWFPVSMTTVYQCDNTHTHSMHTHSYTQTQPPHITHTHTCTHTQNCSCNQDPQPFTHTHARKGHTRLIHTHTCTHTKNCLCSQDTQPACDTHTTLTHTCTHTQNCLCNQDPQLIYIRLVLWFKKKKTSRANSAPVPIKKNELTFVSYCGLRTVEKKSTTNVLNHNSTNDPLTMSLLALLVQICQSTLSRW